MPEGNTANTDTVHSESHKRRDEQRTIHVVRQSDFYKTFLVAGRMQKIAFRKDASALLALAASKISDSGDDDNYRAGADDGGKLLDKTGKCNVDVTSGDKNSPLKVSHHDKKTGMRLKEGGQQQDYCHSFFAPSITNAFRNLDAPTAGDATRKYVREMLPDVTRFSEVAAG